MSSSLPVLIKKAEPDAINNAFDVPVIVSGGETADAVFDPVPVTNIVHPAPATVGGVNEAFHTLIKSVENPETVDAPCSPRPRSLRSGPKASS